VSMYIIYALALLGSFLARRAIRQDETCGYIAEEINKVDNVDDKKMTKLVVVCLTDPNENKWAFLGYLLIILSIAFKWYYYSFVSALGLMGIVCLLLVVIGVVLFSKPDQPKYIADVVKSLHRRKKEYLDKHDLMRADAINYYIEKVESKFRLKL